jgi:hypothetical protein
MRRRQVHKARIARQSIYDESLFINFYSEDAQAKRLKQESWGQITWVLHRNTITGRQQNAGDKIKCLLGPVGNGDIVRRRLDSRETPI